MLVSSVESMFSPEPKLMPAPVAIYVTLFSIVGKLLLALYQYRQGKRVQSALLTANAVNMRTTSSFRWGCSWGSFSPSRWICRYSIR